MNTQKGNLLPPRETFQMSRCMGYAVHFEKSVRHERHTRVSRQTAAS
jgi:hypothetical protein